jgi:hypothetical protein
MPMSGLRTMAAALACTGAIAGSAVAGSGAADAAGGPAAAGRAAVAGRAAAAGPHGGRAVTALVEGDTYVLLGPSVFGVTVQQDPLAYHAVRLADGTVRGHWRYRLWQAGQETTFSGPVTCMTVSGNRAWLGGPIAASSDPTQVGMGAWWQVADNGTGRHPVVPDRTTFVGTGTMAKTLAYCADSPAPHFIFDVQLGFVRVTDRSSSG